jgi:heme A synthase
VFGPLDQDTAVPLGFILGILCAFLLWGLCIRALDRRYTLKRQMQIGMGWFVGSFFLVAPLGLSLMRTSVGALLGSFLFAFVEAFFMVVIQSARLRDRE